jgi:hypothetical protein
MAKTAFALLEREKLEPEDYKTGTALTSEVRELADRNGDLWIISFIDNIFNDNIRNEIGYAFNTLDLKDYLIKQMAWIEKEKSHLNRRLGRKATSSELADDFYVSRVPYRFRLFYALKYPFKVELRQDISEERAFYARAFTERAEEISGRNYVEMFYGEKRGFLARLKKKFKYKNDFL